MGVSVFCNPRISGGMSWGCCFRPRFAASRGPSHARPRRLYASGGGDWLYAAVVALEAGEGMGARVLRLAHATPAARTVVRVFVAAPSRSVGPVHGWGPPPPHAVGPPSAIGPISPRAVFRAVGGSFCQRQKATPAHQGLSLPARKLGGPRPVSEVLTRPRVWCGPWPRRCRLACSPCSCRRTCSPPRRT